MAATRSLNKSRKKKPPLPFYEVPSSKTSAMIIAEARNSVRTIPTNRPYTPADHRILFGSNSSQSRPPSAYSIGARHFSDEKLSRPGTSQRLAPITGKTHLEDPQTQGIKPTPPTPVQSYQDLSVLTLAPASNTKVPQPQHYQVDTNEEQSRLPSGPAATQSKGQSSNTSHSLSTMGDSETRFRGELTAGNSGDLELKQSLTSPVHSKRALSADTLKKFLSTELKKRGGDNGDPRVLSAGNLSRNTSESLQVERKGERKSSGGNKARESRKQSVVDLPFWDVKVAPLLAEVESTSYEEIDHLCRLCSQLWTCLESNNLLGRTGGVGGTKRRSSVLRVVFKLLDHKEPKLLLKVAKIIVAMQVTGKNLLNVCKLLFSMAKDESNDQLFKEEGITGYLIKVLMLADPLNEQETMVYGLGTLKLLASCSDLRELLVNIDVVTLMAKTLKVCCEIQSSSNLSTAHLSHMLIQLTGALRNLSDSPSICEMFISADIIPQLASLLLDHMTNADIIFNISRLFSKLTLNSSCLSAVLQIPAFLPLFLQVLSTHLHHKDIILRVCFILGNMTADNEETRHSLFFQHSPLSHLNPLFQHYLNLEMEKIVGSNREGNHVETSSTQGDRKKSRNSKCEDILIKLIRLVANLSVHQEVGPMISRNQDTTQYLVIILANFPASDYEELVLNSLTTLNNLSYYAQTDSFVVQRQTELAKLLVNVMVVEGNSTLLESTRVCGNLSRYPAVRNILVQNKVDELMVTLLDSGQREMVYSACGVLLNLLADSAFHQNIAKNGGIRKLVEVLHDLGHGDWQLASLACKTLWNFSEKMTSSVARFGEEETIQLIQLLTSYLDEAFALPAPPSSSSSSPQDPRQHEMMAAAWLNDFRPVGQSLLARIKAHHSDLVPF